MISGKPYNWDNDRQSLKSIWNLPDPDFDFLAGDIGLKPSISLWYGVPGSFKTLILQDLAVCVAAPEKKTWLDPLLGDKLPPIKIKDHYPILWIDQDSGILMIKKRFKALAMGHQIKPTDDITWVSMPSPPVQLFGSNRESTRNTILQEIKNHKAGMVVIDNLGAISAGADENSKDMLDILTELRFITDQTNVSLHLIHHANKTGSRSQSGVRGHTSIMQAVDFAFEILREEGTDNCTITCTKSRHAPINQFNAYFSYDNKGNQLTEARFWRQEPDLDNPDISKKTKAIIEIRKFFRDGMNQSEIVKTCSVGRHSVLTALKQMENDKELIGNDFGNGKSRIYQTGPNWL